MAGARGRLGGGGLNPATAPRVTAGSARTPTAAAFLEQELDAPLTGEEPSSGLWSAGGLTDTGPLSLSVALLS